MNKTSDEIIRYLDDHQIEYDLYYHKPVHNIKQLNELTLPLSEYISRSIFLSDDKNEKFYLISLKNDKNICLNELKLKLSTGSLSFASRDDIERYLGSSQGLVTPLGVLNDTERNVWVYIDEWFKGKTIGFHSLFNTETLFMETGDLMSVLNDRNVEFKEV